MLLGPLMPSPVAFLPFHLAHVAVRRSGTGMPAGWPAGRIDSSARVVPLRRCPAAGSVRMRESKFLPPRVVSPSPFPPSQTLHLIDPRDADRFSLGVANSRQPLCSFLE